MLETIVVPLDGSPLAEHALPYAEALARVAGSRVVLVSAVSVDRIPYPPSDPTAPRDLAESEAEAYLATVVARPTSAPAAVVAHGDAAQVIEDQVRAHGADLVVMATHGRSGLGRWVYGSVAEAVLTRSSAPVLLVRAWQPAPDAAALADHPRLLVPLDGSAFSEAALPVARAVAEKLAGEVVLMTAVRPSEPNLAADGLVTPDILEGAVRGARAEARRYLAQVAERLVRDLPSNPPSRDVRVGEPAETVVRSARDHGASMVVMATHGFSGVPRLLFGSVAGAILRQGTVPLLLVRPSNVPTQAASTGAAREASEGLSGRAS